MDVVPGRAVIASKGEQALEAQTYVAKEHVYVYLKKGAGRNHWPDTLHCEAGFMSRASHR